MQEALGHSMRCLVKSSLCVLTCSALGAGCASTYMTNRAKDLTDVAHIEHFSVYNGGMANVGPVPIGLSIIGAPPHTMSVRTKIGLGGMRKEWVQGACLGFLYVGDRVVNKEEKEFFCPPIGSVGIDFGFGQGLGVRVDAIEAIDFILGILTIDFMSDDFTCSTKNIVKEVEHEYPAVGDIQSGASVPALKNQETE